MSIEFCDVVTESGTAVTLTQFSRGRGAGVGCQLTIGAGDYVPLTAEEAVRLGAALLTWAALSDGITRGELLAYGGAAMAFAAESLDGIT